MEDLETRTGSWDDWLFACERCNTGWKRCLFPVRDPALPPAKDRAYEPLLLMPYDGPDPAEHLGFDELGAVWGASEIGDATIETAGLHRPSLVRLRATR